MGLDGLTPPIQGVFPRSPVLAAEILSLTSNLIRDFHASGSAQTTTGTVAADSTALTLASALTLEDGQAITVYGAGPNTGDYAVGAPAAPVLSQVAGSSSFTANQVVYVGISWILPTGETALSPVVPITITANGNDIVLTTQPLPLCAVRAGVYVGPTNAPLQLGAVVVSSYTYQSYSGSSSSGLSSTWTVPLGPGGLNGPWVTNSIMQFFITISALASATGAAPQPAGTTVASQPSQPSITVIGGTGSTTYGYQLVALTPDGGCTMAGQSNSIADGPTNLSDSDYNEITWSWAAACGFAVYGLATNPSSSQGLLGFSSGATYYDKGTGPITVPQLPSTAPVAAVPDFLRAHIVSGAGSTACTLDYGAVTAVIGAAVYPRDSEALYTGLSATLANGGGRLHIPAGTYYLDPYDMPYLDENGETLRLLVEGDGRATRLVVLPGASGSNAAIFSQWSTSSIVYDAEFANFDLDGGSDQGAIAIGFDVVPQEWYFTNVNVSKSYDGINMAGAAYSQTGYMNDISGCIISDCTHVGLATTDDSFAFSCIVGNCGQGTSSDQLDCGVLMLGGGAILGASHLFGNWTDTITYGDHLRIAGCYYDNDAVKEHIVISGTASFNSIVGNTFGPNQVQTSGHNAVAFKNLYGSAQYNAFVANVFLTSAGFYPYEYAIEEIAGCDYNVIQGNIFADAYYGAQPVALVGAHTLIQGNDVAMPVGSVTPPASPLVSGTVYQNTSRVAITIYQSAYATVSGTAGSVAVALGATSAPTALYTDIVNAGTSASVPRTLVLRVPPGWYYSFTTTGSTLAVANIQGE